MKKIGVLLSGCGFLDGTEIQEAVLTLLALEKAGAEAVCFAPDIVEHHVVNHLTGIVAEDESRNVLVESARIVRGAIANLRTIEVNGLDALILPGGCTARPKTSAVMPSRWLPATLIATLPQPYRHSTRRANHLVLSASPP